MVLVGAADMCLAAHAPRVVRLFKNRPSLGFEDMRGVSADAEVSDADFSSGTLRVDLSASKWRNTTSLTVRCWRSRIV